MGLGIAFGQQVSCGFLGFLEVGTMVQKYPQGEASFQYVQPVDKGFLYNYLLINNQLFKLACEAKKIKAKRASHPVKKASAIKLCQAWQDPGKPGDVSKQLGGIKSTDKVKSSQTRVGS